ncbi:hypothetical protein LCGC14_2717450 [marine sediment metagenome]|uniref:DUF7352 domain-containing protein n=1 Tax=marine sediment metagenome TaxID=412755 RepID=A0A0F8ZB84_9ZZZZ
MQIWKVPLEITDEQKIALPKGARILSVQAQADVLCLWALIDPDATPRDFTIRIFGTGHPADDAVGLEFIGTTQMLDSALVWHVFKEA